MDRWPSLILVACAACERADEACWVADRAANCVVLLDGELLPVTSVAIDAPRLVAVDEEGLWIAHGRDGASPWATRLSRLTHDLALREAHAFDAIRALCVHPRGGLAVVEQRSRGEDALWRVEPGGGAHVELELAGLALVAADRENVLVGLEDGGLVLLRADGAVLEWTTLDGPPRALCAGHDPGTWWVLWGERDERLACLGPGFARLLERPATGAQYIEASTNGVWAVGPGGAILFGDDGEPWRHREELAPGDEPAAVAALGREAVWLLTGAVVRSSVLARELRVRTSQGGFGALTDVATTRLSAWTPDGARGAPTPRRPRRRRLPRRRALRAGCGPCWP